jgi:competence protein ComEC
VIGRIGGNEFRFGDSEVRVLAPPRHWRAALKPRNDDSLVLRIAYKKSAVLLAADAERKMERWIAGQQPQADLLKVGHNGSATSTSPELLAAVSPRWAVISVGFRNRFRHPRPEVLARLAAAGTSTFRTDTMGAVTFYLDGKAAQPAPR